MKKAILMLLCLSLLMGLAACMSDADRTDNTKDGVIGDGLREDMNDLRQDVNDVLDGRDDTTTTTRPSGTTVTPGTGNMTGTTGTTGTAGTQRSYTAAQR